MGKLLIFFVSAITIVVEFGSTVICESSGKTQTQTSNGSVVFTVISAATYTITATIGDETASDTVERSTITVNVAAEAYVTCMDGTTALDGKSNGFEVHNAAARRIAASMNGRRGIIFRLRARRGNRSGGLPV